MIGEGKELEEIRAYIDAEYSQYGPPTGTQPIQESMPDPAVTPEVTGAPRLAVDQTVVDEGYVKLDTLVRTTFRLRNIGDQPLYILGEPQVELVEGC